MKKSEIPKALTQDLILDFVGFIKQPDCSKQSQKEAFWIIDELAKREIISDVGDFLGKLRYMFRWDCVPDKYREYIVKE